MTITVKDFLLAIAQAENLNDEVNSLATWCGNPNAKYTLHVTRADGTEYEINIKEEKTV